MYILYYIFFHRPSVNVHSFTHTFKVATTHHSAVANVGTEYTTTSFIRCNPSYKPIATQYKHPLTGAAHQISSTVIGFVIPVSIVASKPSTLLHSVGSLSTGLIDDNIGGGKESLDTGPFTV